MVGDGVYETDLYGLVPKAGEGTTNPAYGDHVISVAQESAPCRSSDGRLGWMSY